MNLMVTKLDRLISWIRKTQPTLQRYPSRTDLFHRILQRDVFPGLKMSSPRRNDMDMVIGACELRTGTAFRFGNAKSGGWRQGEMDAGDVDVGFAVAASAAFPLLLPALDRTWKFRQNGQEMNHRVLLTDGGVYDNLGLQVLEPGRDPTVSLHTFPCEYLIVCNAGHGREAGTELPLGLFARVSRSFEIIYRRVQDMAMHRLHLMKQSGQIKEFVLPYLGQQDDNLPWKQSDLVPRGEVVDYPTDFAAMSKEWIDKLSLRGYQLTKGLVNHYFHNSLAVSP